MTSAVAHATGLPRPTLDLGALPDLAHGEFDNRGREVVALGQLEHALTADPEEFLNLGRADEMVRHSGEHRGDGTSHLTSRQEPRRLGT